MLSCLETIAYGLVQFWLSSEFSAPIDFTKKGLNTLFCFLPRRASLCNKVCLITVSIMNL